MEFTPEQITELISEITNGEQGFQGLVKQGLESLMHSERAVHNAEHNDVSNGYRDRRVCYDRKVFELRVPRSRNSNFYPMLLGVLKDQEEEAQKLVSSLYCSGLTTEQVGKIYEQFYGKHYSKSQVSRLLNTAREDVNAWLGRKLEKRYPILYIDATYVLTRRDESVSNEAYYTVLGVKEDRTREVLTVVNFPTESATNWKDVFEGLKERGVAVVDAETAWNLKGKMQHSGPRQVSREKSQEPMQPGTLECGIFGIFIRRSSNCASICASSASSSLISSATSFISARSKPSRSL